ncbi:MAG: hypothetical protein ACLQU4_13230 [Limisphaerales bacterium]
MNEQELLVDALRRLNRVGLPYMLTGSMASNYWGIPRTTHDLDFVIHLPAAGIPKMMQEFGGDLSLDEESVRAASRPPYQFNAIDTRSALKIDFWMARPVAFDQEMFRRRMKVMIFGEPAWISTKEDVILHKLYWDHFTPSERQLGDAAGIVAIQREHLDLDYLRQWAREIGVGPVLEKVLDGTIKPKTT